MVALESHPIWHYALAIVMYHLGLFANMLIAAHLSTASKNNAVSTLKDYLKLRWMALTVRWIVCLFTFLGAWENPSLGLEKVLDDSLALHMSAAGFLGFASDELTSKVLALLGIQKELPSIPIALDAIPTDTQAQAPPR